MTQWAKVSILDSNFGCSPTAVTQLNGIVYISCVVSSIVAYSGKFLLLQNNISLSAISTPVDIVASNVSSCLYVADYSVRHDYTDNCVWRINVTAKGYKVDKFISAVPARTLSVAGD